MEVTVQNFIRELNKGPGKLLVVFVFSCNNLFSALYSAHKFAFYFFIQAFRSEICWSILR
ncbi:hypothetical protein SAMN05660742_11363 [Propionispira arboris]|uniref:Uncharacterized protein n=1 Tax=Propionispira arboris TaxID=84035 RepID=A0A1H7AY92_9FIRM|nr:hypothetical protein SAMN05660742_11363 [Propionispira arboris]